MPNEAMHELMTECRKLFLSAPEEYRESILARMAGEWLSRKPDQVKRLVEVNRTIAAGKSLAELRNTSDSWETDISPFGGLDTPPTEAV